MSKKDKEEIRKIIHDELEAFHQRHFIVKIDKEWVDRFNSMAHTGGNSLNSAHSFTEGSESLTP